jgi:hypothetical protein
MEYISGFEEWVRELQTKNSATEAIETDEFDIEFSTQQDLENFLMIVRSRNELSNSLPFMFQDMDFMISIWNTYKFKPNKPQSYFHREILIEFAKSFSCTSFYFTLDVYKQSVKILNSNSLEILQLLLDAVDTPLDIEVLMKCSTKIDQAEIIDSKKEIWNSLYQDILDCACLYSQIPFKNVLSLFKFMMSNKMKVDPCPFYKRCVLSKNYNIALNLLWNHPNDRFDPYMVAVHLSNLDCSQAFEVYNHLKNSSTVMSASIIDTNIVNAMFLHCWKTGNHQLSQKILSDTIGARIALNHMSESYLMMISVENNHIDDISALNKYFRKQRVPSNNVSQKIYQTVRRTQNLKALLNKEFYMMNKVKLPLLNKKPSRVIRVRNAKSRLCHSVTYQ